MQSQLNSERGYYAARHVTACRRRAEAAFRAYRKRRRIGPNGRSSMIATRRPRLLIHFSAPSSDRQLPSTVAQLPACVHAFLSDPPSSTLASLRTRDANLCICLSCSRGLYMPSACRGVWRERACVCTSQPTRGASTPIIYNDTTA